MNRKEFIIGATAAGLAPALFAAVKDGLRLRFLGTGAVTAYRRGVNSPAIDTGDPAMKCVEPKPNGPRVNLGAYGNTPWATMSDTGLLLFVR